jgi:hypothetical protein
VSGQAPAPPPPGDELLRVAEAVHAGEVSVAFRPGPTVLAKLGDKLHALERTIRRVVVIGAGVAGVTAAEEIRGALAQAELALIGDEPYAFYNRMAITRLAPLRARPRSDPRRAVSGPRIRLPGQPSGRPTADIDGLTSILSARLSRSLGEPPVPADAKGYRWGNLPVPADAEGYRWGNLPVPADTEGYHWGNLPVPADAEGYRWGNLPVP